LKTRWTRPALADLEAIADFIGRDNPHAAQRVIVRIVGAVETLGEHPHLGRPGRIAGTRELVVADTP
jgi:toxin ParE1/3/4